MKLRTMLQDSALDPHEPANDYVADEAKHDDNAEGHDDVGSILKRTRAQSGYTLEQVSQALNIRLQHIAAIEESRVKDLPGLPYAVGFVKAYANFLGLDDHAIVTRYKEEVQLVPGAQQRLSFPEPVDEARVPKGTMITLSLAAALAIYGVWYFVSSYDAVRMVTVPDVPDRVAANSVGPKSILPSAAEAVSESVAPDANATTTAEVAKTPEKSVQKAATATKTPAPAAESTKTEPTKVASAEKTVEKTAPVAAPAVAAASVADESDVEDSELPTPPVDSVDGSPVAAQADQFVATLETPEEPAAPAGEIASAAIEAPHVPKTYGSEAGDVRVVIRAATDSWVQVESADEDILLSRVLKAGDSYRVPNRDGLTMMTGNAGALDIVVDGQSIGSLGPLGAVRRGITLEPSSLEARANTNTARN